MTPAFESAGKAPGLEIWRIENFTAVKYPKTDYGKFYIGDSYIVLSSTGTAPNLHWDIHFWLGKETTQDESGAAAIMSIELDDSLGGGPVQHREVQEHESTLFLSYFPTGIRYLSGGVASGFHHVDRDAVEKRLFQVKGKRNIRVRQVELNVKSMNKGDCFILDVGKNIYIYTGVNSKRLERIKAISAANQIRDQDHSGKSQITIIDVCSTDREIDEFFKELGSGSQFEVAEESEGGDDEQFEYNLETAVTLWKVSDETGTLEVTKVGVKPLSQTLLDANDSFILDTVTSGIFVWIGKNANTEEKMEAMKRALQFLENNSYPPWTQIKRIVQAGEPPDFKQYFNNWKTAGDVTSPTNYQTKMLAPSLPEQEFDVSSLHARRIAELRKSSGKAFGFMPDEGTGTKVVYRIDKFRLATVDESMEGMFFGGDSYVIVYTYEMCGKDNHIIYFWQGNESSKDDKAASAFHAVRLDSEMTQKSIQVRVTQGNEPRHFLYIFKGKMIVFKSGHQTEVSENTKTSTRLFQVHGTNSHDVRAVQVAEVSASLSSDDVFILEIPTATHLWFGRGASDEEKAVASTAARRVAPNNEPIIINEGEEPVEFWQVLGGKGPYNTKIDEEIEMKPRLFHCHIEANGKFSVEEIQQYHQEDLTEDSIIVLDSGKEIYIWIGSKSTEEGKKRSMEMAKNYLTTDPSDRSHDMSLIFTVKQGDEPDGFTAQFPTWK